MCKPRSRNDNLPQEPATLDQNIPSILGMHLRGEMTICTFLRVPVVLSTNRLPNGFLGQWRTLKTFFFRKNKPGFSKPCLSLSDTRHFPHFRRVRGSEERSLCSQWDNANSSPSPFSSKRHVFGRGQKHGLPKTRLVPPRFLTPAKLLFRYPYDLGTDASF